MSDLEAALAAHVKAFNERGLLPTLTIDNVIVGGDQAAAQLTETLTAHGAGHTFAIAGFYPFPEGAHRRREDLPRGFRGNLGKTALLQGMRPGMLQ